MSEALSPTWPPPAPDLTFRWDAVLHEWLVLDKGEELAHFDTLLEAEQFVIDENKRRAAVGEWT